MFIIHSNDYKSIELKSHTIHISYNVIEFGAKNVKYPEKEGNKIQQGKYVHFLTYITREEKNYYFNKTV